MDNRSLELLEFPRVRKMISAFGYSQEGILLMEEQAFFHREDELRAFLGAVREAKSRIESGDEIPQLVFPEIGGLMDRIGKEGTLLEGKELADIAVFSESSTRLARFLAADETCATLREHTRGLPDLRDLSRKILASFDEEGNVREDAVPELRSIKKKIAQLNTDMERLAAEYLHNQPSLFQTDVPTQKDGRILLPMKSNYKGRIEGIVHDVSGKGATLYIEPVDLMEKNNQKAMHENMYRQVILRILRACSAEVTKKAEELKLVVRKTAFLDSICARARFAVRHSCTEPAVCERTIQIRNARHPLLGQRAVPISVKLDSERRIMVITGPNTGGKTVTLKTIGLFSALTQYGSFLPCDEGAVFPLFDDIWADIGDDQSIDQSLSTFSGHMQRIATIIERATSNSLVLLDELGGGTDPEEGAAIGMAVLDHFLALGSFLVTTTHNGAMKRYGMVKPGAFNASVSFDAERLVPTYKVIPGISGESHARAIAGKNRIPKAVLDAADAYLAGNRTDLSAILQELSDLQNELHLRDEALRKRERELTERIRKNDLHHLQVKQKEHILKEQGYRELKDFLLSSRKGLENLVKNLREGELSREKTLEVKRFIAEVENKMGEVEDSLSEEDLPVQPEAEEETGAALEPGMDVLVGKEKRRGTLVRRGKKGQWTVAVESLKLTVSEEELRPVKQRKAEPSCIFSVTAPSGGERPTFLLDVRGFRLDEAILLLEKQIDRALLSGLSEFHIVHGYGEGILQKGIHDYLRKTRDVAEYFFAHPDMGGFGKTIVRLRSGTDHTGRG